VQLFRVLQLPLQWLHHRLWHSNETILFPFGTAERDLSAIEIKILQPQIHRLTNPQASTVEQLTSQLCLASQPINDHCRLFDRQHNRQSLRTNRPHRIDLLNIHLQHFPKQKQRGLQCSVLCGRRHVFDVRQIAQPRLQAIAAQGSWMAILAKFPQRPSQK